MDTAPNTLNISESQYFRIASNFFSIERSSKNLRHKNPGFSLIELLAVIAIISIMMALVTPALLSLQESTQLSRAGQTITDTLALARQTALSRNRNIAVRFFQPVNGGPYIALQTFLLNDDGTEQPQGRLYRLPQQIILSDSTNHSKLPQPSTNVFQLPGQEVMKYSEFYFRRNGRTNLDSSQYWFLSIIYERERTKDRPSNFISLLIDPNNGTVKVSRP